MNITSNTRRYLRALVATILVTSLGACGGGGGGGDTVNPPPPPPPPATTYSVGGTVSSLTGSGLILQNNGGNDLSVNQDGSFTFGAEVDSGASYSVTVLTQPTGPSQTCSVANGTGTATADVNNVSVTCVDNTSSTDTDGDGLTDADELNIYGTSPDDSDTDGDGYTDDNELLTFDPTVNNFRFNPLVADIPEILITVAENPNIGANITEQNSSVETVQTTRSNVASSTSSTTFGASTTLGVEASQSATTGASLSGPSAEIETSVKVTAEATVSFDATSTNENRNTWEEMLANNIERSTTTSDGFIRVGIEVENAGHLSFTVQSLDLQAERVTRGDDPFSGLPPLTYAGAGGFTPFALEQNSPPQKLTYGLDGIDLPTLRSLLTDTRSLKIDPGIVDVTDSSGTRVEIGAEAINRRTAKILIDYGPYARTELYRAATNVVPGAPGRVLSDLMNETLRVPYTQDGSGITTVRSISSLTGRWVITIKRKRDTETEITTYDPDEGSYDINALDVRAFDEVLFVLLEDPDGDGIGYREELLHGTDPNSTDTDGDGRSDFEEIREGWTVNAINAEDPNRYSNQGKVFSSPRVADYDGDSLSDTEEFNRGLDPYNADTDGDGIADNMDTSNGGEPLYSNLPLLLGQNPFDANTSPLTVETSGVIGAQSPQVVATATIDWESDGNADETFNTIGGNPEIDVPLTSFDYPGPGTYQISLSAVDDATPANTLDETATVVLTEAETPISGLGYSLGYRSLIHLRTVADVNNDGFDDVIAISNSNTQVVPGSATGFMPLEVWSTGNWHPPIFESVATDPRFFVDINGDGLLDIVGVDSSDDEVRYGLNNGSGFDDPVVWATGLNWNEARDTAYVADVDFNGFADFMHASTADGGVTAYTSSGSTLNLTKRPTATFASVYPNRARYPIHVSDVDNDGCADIVLFGVGSTFVSLSQCNGSFGTYDSVVAGLSYDVGYRVGQEKRWVEDVSGDGLPDLVAAAEDTFVVLVNASTPGTVAFNGASQLTDDFTSANGWADVTAVGGQTSYGVYPRHLADVNDDGYKDVVGFAGAGAALGINELGTAGTLTMTPVRIVAPAYAIADPIWWGPRIDNPASANPFEDCTSIRPCRDYAPRLVGDIDGDGRADLIGFSDTEVIYQPMPYVTQFE